MNWAEVGWTDVAALVTIAGVLAYVFAGQVRVRGADRADDARTKAIGALETRIAVLEGERGDLKAEVAALRLKIAEVTGEAQGRRQALRDVMEAVAISDICSEAPGCPNRKAPEQVF